MSTVLDLAVGFPAGRVTAKDLQASSGVPLDGVLAVTHCEEFPGLGDDEPAWQLAASVACSVLERARIPAARVDCVIYAGSGEWDHPFWSPAARIARELGIDGAHCFEVANFCNAGAVALQIASDRVERGGGLTLVLIGDRLSRLVDRSDPEAVDLFNFGDSCAAVLVGTGSGLFTMRGSAMRTDPSWSDYYRGADEDGRTVIRREPHRRGLAAAYVENFTKLVEQVLGGIGAQLSDVAYLLINQGDRWMHERLLKELDLPEERSVLNYHRLGHMGGADTLIALDALREAGRLHTGDLVLLLTSAMGFSWGVTAWEYTR